VEGRAGAAVDERGEGTIDEEVRLVQSAQLAIQSGEPRRALSLLDEHARRFPNGMLADAREVARIAAWCNAGERTLARARAEEFLARHPGSPFADRVRNLCLPAP
jgi:outer membrane protein assembly factor BamD (BamD/ComL family)